MDTRPRGAVSRATQQGHPGPCLRPGHLARIRKAQETHRIHHRVPSLPNKRVWQTAPPLYQQYLLKVQDEMTPKRGGRSHPPPCWKGEKTKQAGWWWGICNRRQLRYETLQLDDIQDTCTWRLCRPHRTVWPNRLLYDSTRLLSSSVPINSELRINYRASVNIGG